MKSYFLYRVVSHSIDLQLFDKRKKTTKTTTVVVRQGIIEEMVMDGWEG